jgi:hypothetical protein
MVSMIKEKILSWAKAHAAVPLEEHQAVERKLQSCQLNYRSLYHRLTKWEMAAKHHRQEVVALKSELMKQEDGVRRLDVVQRQAAADFEKARARDEAKKLWKALDNIRGIVCTNPSDPSTLNKIADIIQETQTEVAIAWEQEREISKDF